LDFARRAAALFLQACSQVLARRELLHIAVIVCLVKRFLVLAGLFERAVALSNLIDIVTIATERVVHSLRLGFDFLILDHLILKGEYLLELASCEVFAALEILMSFEQEVQILLGDLITTHIIHDKRHELALRDPPRMVISLHHRHVDDIFELVQVRPDETTHDFPYDVLLDIAALFDIELVVLTVILVQGLVLDEHFHLQGPAIVVIFI